MHPHTYFDTPMKNQLHEALPEITGVLVIYDTGTRDVVDVYSTMLVASVIYTVV